MQLIAKTILFVLTIFSCGKTNNGSLPNKELGNMLYNNSIFIPVDASEELKSTAKDLAYWLKEGTGQNFKVQLGKSNSGIVLSKIPNANFNDRELIKLNEAPNQSFYSLGNSSSLYLYGKSDAALANGVYSYLDQLGYKWYLPGENWTIVPKLNTIHWAINKAHIPDFINRDFFGTGGILLNKELDPDNAVKKDWNLWKKRNRFGQDIKTSGHAGATFNRAHKETLLKHPEYLAEIDGKRVPFSNSAKLCISNKNLVQLFIADRIKNYEQKLKRFGKDDYRALAVSVEPSDGAKHCTCGSCKAMGSISTRYFGLANEVAKTIRKKYPKAKVFMYAYNRHADVPDIELEENLLISVIPYSFQRVASPEVLLENWSNKIDDFFIYDYLAIPDWKKDLPNTNPKQIAKKIRYWHSNNVNGVTFESSYSSASVGLSLYIASKIMWDLNENEDDLLNAFFEDCFGSAKMPIQSLYNRWWKNYNGVYDTPFSYENIKQASSLTNDSKIEKRINELKAYLIYTNLFNKYTDQDKGTSQQSQKAIEIINYIWSIHDLKMIHTSRMHNLIVNKHEKKNPQFKQKWAFKKIKPTTWSSMKPLSPAQINSKFEALPKNKLFADQKIQAIQENFETFTPSKNIAQQSDVEFSLRFSNQMKFYGTKNQNLKFYYKGASTVRTKEDNFLCTFFIENEKVLLNKDVPLDQDWTLLDFTLPVTGWYTLNTRNLQSLLHLKFTPNTSVYPFFYKKYNFFNTPKKVYFYVPQNTNEVFFNAKKIDKLIFSNPANKKVNVTEVEENLFKINIPKEYQNDLWSFNAKKEISFLNIPNNFYLTNRKVFISKSNQ